MALLSSNLLCPLSAVARTIQVQIRFYFIAFLSIPTDIEACSSKYRMRAITVLVLLSASLVIAAANDVDTNFVEDSGRRLLRIPATLEIAHFYRAASAVVVPRDAHSRSTK